MKKDVAAVVLAVVDAPYGTGITAAELAVAIADPRSAAACHPNVFGFFSEVDEETQRAFIERFGIDPEAASRVAKAFEEMAGFSLPLGSVAGTALG